jgi:hypothetical protein
LSNNKPPTSEIVFASISFALLLILFPLAEWIRVHCPDWAFKSVAGYLLGTIGAFSYATISRLCHDIKKDGAAAIDENVWTRPFSILFYLLIAVFGLIAWITSWEGKTGIAYGVGVLIGATLMEAGGGSIIKKR